MGEMIVNLNESKFNLKLLTSEQRKEILAKAAASREEKKKAGEHLKQDFAEDENHWRSLASKVGFRLAAKHIPASETKYLKRLLNHLGLEAEWWKEKNGFSKFSDFYKNNPDWPAYAAQGLILEDYFDERN